MGFKIPISAKTIVNGAKALGAAGAIGYTAWNILEAAPPVNSEAALAMQGGMMFPSDLIDPSSDRNFYMSLAFMPYERRSIFNQPFFPEGDGIRLPIPNNLVDTQNVTYTEQGAENAGVGAGIDAAAGAVQANRQSGQSGQSLEDIAKNAIGGVVTGGVLSAVKNLVSGAKLGGSTVDQVLQLAGTAQNPFLTVLFQQPNFKTHTFTWKLAPTSVDESIMLRDIIKTIRANMLPGLTGAPGGTLLGYPSMVQISLLPAEEFLYRFKPCVIESMQVNYAPGSTPGFFKSTKAPTEVALTIQLKEIEYWLQEDVFK